MSTRSPIHLFAALALLVLLVGTAQAELKQKLADGIARVKAIQFEPLRRAIGDLTETFAGRYPKGPEWLRRLDALEKATRQVLSRADAADIATLELAANVAEEFVSIRREALLANPLLDFDKLMLIKRSAGNLGLPCNWQGNSCLRKTGYDNEIAVFSPVRPGGKLTRLYRPDGGKFVGDVDLHFDADKMLFSSIGSHNRWQVFEIRTDGTGLRQVTPGDQPDVDSYDACYLPDGRIIFDCTAPFVGVPCVYGSSHVAVLFIMDGDGKNLRQLCFEQDHDWCPTVLNNGRILYTRWEYTDTPHSNTRLLFHMNPDGTGQMEYCGSNSLWPNSFFYARPIPGHPTKVVSIISGHHGVRRMGELVIFDPAKGRREAEGVVQRIPGYGKEVKPIVADALVNKSWPKFLHPFPLSENYFLVSSKPTPQSHWGVYLVDVFDNMLLLHEEPGYAMLEPVPIRKTPRPPMVPDKVDLTSKNAVVYMADAYRGGGLQGIPRGAVKKLRVFTYHFAYHGMGGLLSVLGVDGPWDIKRVLGTVPVEEDGSAHFIVPANTPISIQPLDSEGKALQIMRSWMTAMPGEVLSCVGCHENPSTTPVNSTRTLAISRPPSKIEPWYGPTRGFSYAREVQPVVDKYCIGCHNDKPRPDGKRIPDFGGTKRVKGYRSVVSGSGWNKGGKFSVGYVNLQRYVRRPGIESDYHMRVPMDFHADTTELVRILRRGHHGVALDAEAWDRLITWIDLNTPFHGFWTEACHDPGRQRQRRRELQKLYAGLDEDPEADMRLKPAVLKPLTDAEERAIEQADKKPEMTKPECAGWPFDAAEAKKRQAAAGSATTQIFDLGGVTMELVLIPAGEFLMGDSDELPLTRVKIEKPFWMGKFEVTNEQFKLFAPDHDSHVEVKLNYQFGVHGYPLDRPRQPVVRVSWQQAMGFCRWLSQKTGRTFTLPTEAQWEYACRAGTDTPFYYGGIDTDFAKFANLGDAKLRDLVSNPYTLNSVLKNATVFDDWVPKETRFNDGCMVTVDVGGKQPNAWGLHDMHGNVAEWTRSADKPYPYRDNDGRNAITYTGSRIVRGGSWRDRPRYCRSGSRLGYRWYQPVFNVGFRVVCDVESAKTTVSAE